MTGVQTCALPISKGAQIDSFGVGTRLGVAASPGEDIPALGIVFKIVSQNINGQDDALMKFSENKETNPGRHQVFRVVTPEKVVDTIALAEEELEGEPMLHCYMRDGALLDIYDPKMLSMPLETARRNASRELQQAEGREIISQRSELLQKLVDQIREAGA